ncbi:MAG: tetratricopeptide repeat protein [Candidatus Zhuqueibacterota bacterium]
MDYCIGGRGYGFEPSSSSTNCRVENDIFRKLRHAFIAAAGSNCNVWTFNYSRKQHSTTHGWTDCVSFSHRCNKALKADNQNTILLNDVAVKYANQEIDVVAKNLLVGDLIDQGDYPGAIEQCLAVTKSFSETEYNKYSLYDLGNIYWYYLNDPKTGATYYRQLIAQYPDDHLAISALATLGQWVSEKNIKPNPDQTTPTAEASPTKFALL